MGRGFARLRRTAQTGSIDNDRAALDGVSNRGSNMVCVPDSEHEGAEAAAVEDGVWAATQYVPEARASDAVTIVRDGDGAVIHVDPADPSAAFVLTVGGGRTGAGEPTRDELGWLLRLLEEGSSAGVLQKMLDADDGRLERLAQWVELGIARLDTA